VNTFASTAQLALKRLLNIYPMTRSPVASFANNGTSLGDSFFCSIPGASLLQPSEI
jgi:hypothetical protein